MSSKKSTVASVTECRMADNLVTETAAANPGLPILTAVKAAHLTATQSAAIEQRRGDDVMSRAWVRVANELAARHAAHKAVTA